jgi:hypothetical protein
MNLFNCIFCPAVILAENRFILSKVDHTTWLILMQNPLLYLWQKYPQVKWCFVVVVFWCFCCSFMFFVCFSFNLFVLFFLGGGRMGKDRMVLRRTKTVNVVWPFSSLTVGRKHLVSPVHYFGHGGSPELNQERSLSWLNIFFIWIQCPWLDSIILHLLGKASKRPEPFFHGRLFKYKVT